MNPPTGMAETMRCLAAVTWHCEVACMALTLSYTLLVLHDIVSTPAARYTNSSWFESGFCIAWESSLFNSHYLCFAVDLPCGTSLAVFSWRKYNQNQDTRLLPALAVGVFNALHGMGHLMIGILGLQAVAARERRTAVVWILQYLVMLAFLVIGPFIAHQVVRHSPCLGSLALYFVLSF